MHKVSGFFAGLALICTGFAAGAQRKVDNIGNAGGIVVGAERLLGVYRSTTTSASEVSQAGATIETEVETKVTAFAVLGHDPAGPTVIPRIALDYFPIDGLSLGGAFMYLHLSGEVGGEQRITSGGTTQTTEIEPQEETQSLLAIHPRIGYAVAFNEIVGLWPRVGFSYTRLQQVDELTITAPPSPPQTFERTVTISFTHLTLEGLLFVSPFTGFAFVGGPFVDIGLGGKSDVETDQPNSPDVNGDTKNTTFGFVAGVAGYFDTQ